MKSQQLINRNHQPTDEFTGVPMTWVADDDTIVIVYVSKSTNNNASSS